MDRDESAQLAELLTETEKEAAIAASDARGEKLGALATVDPEIFHLFEYPWDINRRKEEGATAEMWAEALPYAALLYPPAIPYIAALEGIGLTNKVLEGLDEPAAEELGVLAAVSQVFDKQYIPKSLMGALVAAATGALGSDLMMEGGEHWIAKMLSSPETAAALMSASSGGMVNYGGALEHLTDASAPDPNKLTKDQYQAIHEQSMGEKAPPDAVASYLASTSGD